VSTWLPDHARCTPQTRPRRNPNPASPAHSTVALSCPGLPPHASRTQEPWSNGLRCGVRSRLCRPVMSSSSFACSPTGSAGSRETTSYPSGPVFRTPARSRSRPEACSSSSVVTTSPFTASVPVLRTRTAPGAPSGHRGLPASATSCVTASNDTDQDRPAREPTSPGRPSQPEECRGSRATTGLA
jgi:hypothetical protein